MYFKVFKGKNCIIIISFDFMIYRILCDVFNK